MEIRNFLGLKQPRSVDMFEGVICEKSEDVKDQLIISGNDIELVSQSGMILLHQTVKISLLLSFFFLLNSCQHPAVHPCVRLRYS